MAEVFTDINSMDISLSKLQKIVKDCSTPGFPVHHQLTFGNSQMLVGDGQGSLECCSPWGCKESDMTEQLNRTELN